MEWSGGGVEGSGGGVEGRGVEGRVGKSEDGTRGEGDGGGGGGGGRGVPM